MTKTPLRDTPKEGDYFTGKDVDSIPPPKPKEPPAPSGPRKRYRPVGSFVPLNTAQPPVPKPRDSMQPAIKAYQASRRQEPAAKETIETSLTEDALAAAAAAKQMKEEYALLPPYLRPFLSPSLKRAEGRPATIWTLKLTTDRGGKVHKKYQDFHFIVCWYQFLVGALGGIVVGIETDFFSTRRLPTPNVPLPPSLALASKAVQYSVQHTSAAYRFSKRAVISGYLFDVVEKNVGEYRGKEDWLNMGVSGGITGAFFGLRGGLRGSLHGSAAFAGFASLAGILYHYKKKEKPDK